MQRYKLNVPVLRDRNREILRAPTEGRGREHGTVTKIWQRRHSLAQHVYLEESRFGELRAIKQVHWRGFKSDQSEHQAMNLRELQVMRRVTEVLSDYQRELLFFSSTDTHDCYVEKSFLCPVLRIVPDPGLCFFRDGVLSTRRRFPLL